MSEARVALPMHAGAGLFHRWMHGNVGRWASWALCGSCTAGAVLVLGGCATQYRPVVAAINPVGPAAQPTKYAYVVSDPNEGNTAGSLGGLFSLIDFSGDSVIATPTLIPRPVYFTTLPIGSQGFVINSQNGQNSLDEIPLGQPTSLITSQVVQTTLPVNANAPSISGFSFGATSGTSTGTTAGGGTSRIFVPEPGVNTQGVGAVSILSATSPALQQQLAVPANPVYIVGTDATPRAYVLSSGNGTAAGQASAIEAESLAISQTIPVGINPVYGVETDDVRRAFVLNAGSGTVSVINVTNNAIDTANPTINLDPSGTLGLQPVWADIAPATNQLIVVSKRANNAQGYLSIINIPLCNALAQPTNPTCNANNPSDGVGFGQVLATVPVGVNPVQVAVLEDGSQAYVANQGVLGGTQGSISAVNLVTAQVTNTITGATASSPVSTPTCAVTAVATNASQACMYGHPNTIAATTGTPTGKVYVTAPDSNYLTVIETDTDTVVTHVNLQGIGVRVIVSAR